MSPLVLLSLFPVLSLPQQSRNRLLNFKPSKPIPHTVTGAPGSIVRSLPPTTNKIKVLTKLLTTSCALCGHGFVRITVVATDKMNQIKNCSSSLVNEEDKGWCFTCFPKVTWGSNPNETGQSIYGMEKSSKFILW